MKMVFISNRVTNRRAFTLLEVIVGLFLMGSLVASSLVALSAHQHSIVLAKQKHQANDIAETLLTNWYETRGDVPTRNQGFVATELARIAAMSSGVQFGITPSINNQLVNPANADQWLWRTQPVGSRTVCGLPVAVIRLEIFGKVGNQKTPQSLASIELIQSQGSNVFQ
jgi:type II secretory pathway pseudopilin PulG